MTTLVQIAWVAGLLEGEGCFYHRGGSIAITLSMTDKDIITRVRDVMIKDTEILTIIKKELNASVQYRINLHGLDAIQWMMTIYPLMGKRRQERIRECLAAWKTSRGPYKKVA